ncbi:MAG: hypothetical protein CL522_02125 [Actinobacteria bacterium]|nr:hypothetical protein [Actinomycetota bacterium]|tara:strand:- start:4090 stop:4818 length:729 start_codon:yes stop_codon:yes gene_type:complete
METDLDSLLETYISDLRPEISGAPWIMLNMISSKNGLATLNGTSGALGGPADKALFRTLRGLADVILVAAGTVRTENYSAPVISDRTTQIRDSQNRSQLPTIAVVTNSLNLDPESPLFSSPNYRPAILTSKTSLNEGAPPPFKNTDIFQIGESLVDLKEAIPILTETYGPVILVEGGPNLNQQLVDLDLFDELCITVSPTYSSDPQSQTVTTAESYQTGEIVLDRELMVGDFVFQRFLRKRS